MCSGCWEERIGNQPHQVMTTDISLMKLIFKPTAIAAEEKCTHEYQIFGLVTETKKKRKFVRLV